MFSVNVSGHLDSAHFLRGYNGKCNREHGHRFTYLVTLESDKIDNLGMLVDFVILKSILKDHIDNHLDHYLLNDIPPFTAINPTAENLAKFIYEKLKPIYLKSLSKVRVYESPDAFAEFWE